MDKLTLDIDALKVDTFPAQDENVTIERSTLCCDVLPTECPRTVCASSPCAC
jgi:hypothetical protein